MQFNTKEQIVEALVNEFKEQKSSFYNTDTNKQREKFWTFNRTYNYYLKKKNNGIRFRILKKCKNFNNNGLDNDDFEKDLWDDLDTKELVLENAF